MLIEKSGMGLRWRGHIPLLAFARDFPIRVFEAQIEEDAPLPAAGAHAQGRRNSGNNLKTTGEVISPANARIHKYLAVPLRQPGADHEFTAIEYRFHERIEARMHGPHQAVSQVVGVRCGGVAKLVSGVWNDGRSRVKVRGELLIQYHAHGPVGLDTSTAGAAAELWIARRKHDAQARSNGDPCIAVADQLIAVVQSNVTRARAGSREVAGVRRDDRVTELVPGRRIHRPFLREAVNPGLAPPEPLKIVDVLDDAIVLVV